MQPYNSLKAVLYPHPPPPLAVKSWQTLTLPKSQWAFCCLKDQDFLPRAVMAQSHSCSFTALQKALPRRAQCLFLDTHPHSPGGRRLSFLPARTGALSHNTQHSNNCPRDFQLPLSSHLIPTFCSKEVLGPPPPYQSKLKQFSIIPASLKTEISNTTTSPRPLCSMIKLICGSHLLVFTQMRSTKTHSLRWLCSWTSHTSDNLSKLPLSTRRDTSETTCTPETKDPHPF